MFLISIAIFGNSKFLSTLKIRFSLRNHQPNPCCCRRNNLSKKSTKPLLLLLIIQIPISKAIEDDHNHWEGISSALSVGWLDTAVKLLRLHGSYQVDQLGNRETENGLVEAIAVLVSKMTCMRPELSKRGLGECFKTKPDFMKFSYYAMNGSVTWMELNCYGDVQRMPVMMSF